MNNLSHIEYFVAAVQAGSFSLAARKEYVTPQTVAKAVTKIEDELDLRLFVRDGNAVRPTPYAHLIAFLLDEGLASFRDALIFARDHPMRAPREGALSLLVAHSPYRGSALDLDSLLAFKSVCPSIALSVGYGSLGSCIQALEGRRVDAVVVPGRLGLQGFADLKVAERPVGLALARTNLLAGHGALRLEDLRDVPIAIPDGSARCREVLANVFCDCGIRPNFVRVLPTTRDQRLFFERQRGVAFVVDEPAIERMLPFVVRRPLASNRRIALPTCLVYAENHVNPALTCLAHYLLAAKAMVQRKKGLPDPAKDSGPDMQKGR